jgi:hypothetical protein
MALSDYFIDIVVLVQIEGEDQIGGRIENWSDAVIIQGIINARYANKSTIGGKSGETSEYNGLFEITDTSTTYLVPENRLKDADGKIYKINGKVKNTLNLGHHYKCDLTYDTHLNT